MNDKFIYKIIYNYFNIKTLFYQRLKNNKIISAISSFYQKHYAGFIKFVYQIEPETTSRVWCNTITVKRIFNLASENNANKWINNLLSHFTFTNRFIPKWMYFENPIEFNEKNGYIIQFKSLNEFHQDHPNSYDMHSFTIFTNDSLNFKEMIITDKLIQNMQNSISRLKQKYNRVMISEIPLNLFILKVDNCFFTKIIHQTNPRTTKLPVRYKKSNVTFMTIEYVHSSLKTPLLIDLSSFNFTDESEILGYIFIYWYLKRKYGNWVNKIFDVNYKLNIIDSDFNIFELKPQNYILLNENSYEVNRISCLLK
jgi:hypothetical protein